MTLPAVSTQSALTPAQFVRRAALRKQAETFVGQTFFEPLLKQMRESPFKSELLSGGRGGEVFQSMLDGVLAQRMGRGAGKALVDAIVDKLDPESARILRQTGRFATLATPPKVDLIK